MACCTMLTASCTSYTKCITLGKTPRFAFRSSQQVSYLVLWSDKEILLGTCQLDTRSRILSVPSVKAYNLLRIASCEGRFITCIKNVKFFTYQIFLYLLFSWIDVRPAPYNMVCIGITSNNELRIMHSVVVSDLLQPRGCNI
jgi:hypothetical protein